MFNFSVFWGVFSSRCQGDNKATVFVTNIQHNMDEDTLKSLFEKVRAKPSLLVITLVLPLFLLSCVHM